MQFSTPLPRHHLFLILTISDMLLRPFCKRAACCRRKFLQLHMPNSITTRTSEVLCRKAMPTKGACRCGLHTLFSHILSVASTAHSRGRPLLDPGRGEALQTVPSTLRLTKSVMQNSRKWQESVRDGPEAAGLQLPDALAIFKTSQTPESNIARPKSLQH